MITLSGIKKDYGGRCVLDIPEFVFERGGRYALLGANGSGKSTLLRILAGIITPDAGKIVIGDPSGIGYMPQRPYAFGFSTEKNVEIAFRDKAAHRMTALDALDKVGMREFAHARGNSLSGGEMQRMAFARLLVVEYGLLLLDEPTSAADVQGSMHIEEALIKYCQEVGSTLVFATHSLAQAQRVSNMMLLLDHGQVIESGPTNIVLKAPREAKTKNFLQYWDTHFQGTNDMQ